VIKELNSGGDDAISYTDFLAATLDGIYCNKDGPCHSAFRVFDRDGDGYISKQELCDILREPSDSQAVAAMIQTADVNLDGFVDYQEFKMMVVKIATQKTRAF
ncbi:unnamed protein product, partial [Polarella glacialis]